MRRILLMFCFVILLNANAAQAQSAQDEIRAVIEHLFDGMRAGDSTMVASVLMDSAIMGRATDNGFSSGSMDGFVRAVGSPHDQVWDERIWDLNIQVDQRLASAWMQFAFYLGDELSHCGVNSMILYRTDDGWKIVHLADTHRGLACGEIPAHARK
ncbi:MAG: nuclear transport factor 2 family protein [Bacteroidota bacterium]|nr:nuclear transport factor 2 family protein [Bacteroidota bacterium]MDE2955393.1 nuclear transport factor 2 family protein [Bacteroidota bacterium]